MSHQFIWLPEIQRLTGLSRSYVRNRVSNSTSGDPDRPHPIPLSAAGRGAVAWEIAEIEELMAKKSEAH